jgi:hypothetical protein
MTFVGATAEGPLHSPAGEPGKYSAAVTLSRPGVRPLPEYDQRPSEALRGDSHVAITKPAYAPPGNPDATEIRCHTHTGVVFSGMPNEKGFLAGFRVYPFEAESFSDAYVKALAKVAPSLSLWSAYLDVPLHVFQVDVLEVASGNTMIAYRNSFPELAIASPPGLADDADFLALISIYREALNSNSLLYQFLCFYKIAEGVQRRRDRAAKRAKRDGASVTRVVETLPQDDVEGRAFLGAIFPTPAPTREPARTIYHETLLPKTARGRTFVDLLGFEDDSDGRLKAVRDLIAHALTSQERGQPFTLVNLDDALLHRRVHQLLPLMKVIARRMLKTEFPTAFLSHVPEPRTTPMAEDQ